jgi:AcrR family transcriptional regulator
MRLEDVATRAGVAKTTIYRRWPTKAELVRSAIESIKSTEVVPDTGSLRKDLLGLVESSLALLSTPEGRAIATMVITECTDPEVNELCVGLREDTRTRRAAVIVRAQERGDIPKDVDAITILDCIFGVIMTRFIRFGERTDRAGCERLIDLVVTGAEHGGGKIRKSSR